MEASARHPHTIGVELGDRRYDIDIGCGLLDDARTWASVPTSPWAAIVTDTCVEPLYAARLEAAITAQHDRVLTIAMSGGEPSKDWLSLNRIFDALLEVNADRRTVLYGLGGGVVGDLAGFAAACYMRGVPYVQVPTTLLAQVDSSVGGKTAINHPMGKNMIGAFYQPNRVVADLDLLDTLPDREVSAGLAEVIKYGPIADESFLDWIEANVRALRQLDKVALATAVRRSCEIKAAVVRQDERESGTRAILNFGHTFGHAIETGLGYGRWLHGEAVGCGMLMAADLSVRLDLIDRAFAQRLARIVERAGLPTRAPALGVDRYLDLMRKDKKAERGEVRFVVLEAPGRAAVRSVPEALIQETIRAYCD